MRDSPTAPANGEHTVVAAVVGAPIRENLSTMHKHLPSKATHSFGPKMAERAPVPTIASDFGALSGKTLPWFLSKTAD